MNLAIPVQLVRPIIIITIQILLSTTAVIVIINNNLGIEFNNSIPLDTNVSIGTFVSSFRYLNLSSKLNFLNKKTVPKIIIILINVCNIPFDILVPNASDKMYFLCPKP